MNRWGVYEALKGSREIDIKELEKASPEEVKEGVIEFLLSRPKGIEGD
jgi:ribosomal protein L20A (L18A)